MSLDLGKLEKARQERGRTIARCPACAEEGKDQKGQHLFIGPDGKFGCILFPGAEGAGHRKRIWELVGAKEDVKVKSFVVNGREEGKGFEIRGRSVKASLMRPFGTVGTPLAESIRVAKDEGTDLGTVGTGIPKLRACGSPIVPEGMEEGLDKKTVVPSYSKKFMEPVPSVPNAEETVWSPDSLEAERRFGGPHARLYPLIGRRVRTPQGGGTLKQVFTDNAWVVLDVQGGKTTEFKVSSVLPDAREGFAWAMPNTSTATIDN
jgi:hypothetical protein